MASRTWWVLAVAFISSTSCGGQQRPAPEAPHASDAQQEPGKEDAPAEPEIGGQPPAPAVAPAEPAAEALDEAEADRTFAEPALPFRTLAEAEAALERARAELLALADAPARQRADKPKKSEAPGTGASGAPAPVSASRCGDACRALESLTRAADGVCRLDDPDGERCRRARSIVADSAEKVRTCGCDDD